MVVGCKTLWTALQILWSTIYVVCGALQLMAAIFFLVSIKELALYSLLVAGCWNILIGIIGGMVACIGALSPKRQETLLYLAASILAVNIVAVVLTEWQLYFFADLPKLLTNFKNHVLADYALFVIRIAIGTVIVVSFLDSQFAYCSSQKDPNKKKGRRRKRVHGSHDQVSDIEYIIPRTKSTKSTPQTHQIYDAYAQSWVFDAENAGVTSNGTMSESASYSRVLQNGTSKNPLARANGTTPKEAVHLVDNPVVHVEEASDDSTSNNDRKLYHMKSFSRSTSPVVLSASSSQISLNNQTYNPVPTSVPIYEYLEKLTEPQVYRSRLNTAVSTKSNEEESLGQFQSVTRVSPQAVEPVQYASLMKELQKAIVSKKEPSSVTSPLSNSESQSHSKSSDTEFSKELEAALQLIQDLESPNTAETPSDPQNSRPLAVWRKNSEASGSEKTLNAVGSIADMTSPLCETIPLRDQPHRYDHHQRRRSSINASIPTSTVAAAAGPLRAPVDGKGARVLVRYPDSQSTSGYSSPSHGPTPNWSTTSSISGSNNDIPNKPPASSSSYHIHNAKSTTVISLYSQPSDDRSKGKSVTLVKISGECDPLDGANIVRHASTLRGKETTVHIHHNDSNNIDEVDCYSKEPVSLPNLHSLQRKPPKQQQQQEVDHAAGLWSLLRKRKSNGVPRLCPELEGAIVKSESLAYLSDVELMARAQRNEEIQREIEKRVIQQLGVPRADSESNC